MTRTSLISFCLSLPGAYEDRPFRDQSWTVIRRRENKKVFAWIFTREGKLWVNVKVDPEWRDFWRNAFPLSILPAYHLNKEHWNSLILDGGIPDKTIKQLIMESYDLVAPGNGGERKKIKGKPRRKSSGSDAEK